MVQLSETEARPATPTLAEVTLAELCGTRGAGGGDAGGGGAESPHASPAVPAGQTQAPR